MSKIKIKWLIAHEPERLFLRTANAFAAELNNKIGDQVEIEILTTKTYVEKYGEQTKNPLNLLNDGDVQMTQTEVHDYGQWNKNFMALDLPFLFRDHDHCTKVLEGDIGRALCKNLAKHANMRGLAFTYSGGFRVLGSNKPISSLEEMKNMRVLTSSSKVLQDTLSTVCADTKTHNGSGPASNYGYVEVDNNIADATETTYIRFQGKHVLKTNHSMFLTTIAINEEFFQGLSQDLQQAIVESAIAAGRLERQWSVEDAQLFEDNCKENGVTIHEFNAADKQEFRDSVMTVYDTWEKEFYPGMIKHIRMQ